MKEQFEKFISECPIIAILRGITTPEVPAVFDALMEAGIRILEIPLNSPDALKSIAAAAGHCKGKAVVGAGTVLSVEDVNAVFNAGGRFIISPNTDSDVIRETKKLNMLSIPGFFTPTEGFEAVRAGADYLKLFPACLGPSYVKDLKAVIKTPILAVGGVNAANIPDFMKVCRGVGVGSALYTAGKSVEDIKRDAEITVKSVKGNQKK